MIFMIETIRCMNGNEWQSFNIGVDCDLVVNKSSEGL